MAHGPDEGAAGAHQWIGDQGRGCSERRLGLGDQVGVFDVLVPHKRADVQGAVGVLAQVVEARDVVDVDDALG